MRQRLNLPGINLGDVLLRLGKNELQVCATASVSREGWGNTLAWNPAATFCHRSGPAGDASLELQEYVAEQQRKGRLLIGYLSYDFGCGLHGVPPTASDDLQIPLIFVAAFDNWLTFDASGAKADALGPEFGISIRQILERARRPLPAKPYKKALAPTESRSWYHQAYQKLQAHILAGDIYQANLTHRLEGAASCSGRELFCRLSPGSQTDFQAYIEGGDFEVLSYSPERFISVKNRTITTMPIKGTRPRGETSLEDKALRADLLSSPKDCAELNMITDLMRNDLGEICEAGSVRVSQPRTLTAYPTLWHAHSEITGRLRHDVSPVAALMSVSPGGSITGCPKKRAIEIINRLEPKRRGVYTGTIFNIKPNGELDSNIAIRTLIKKASKLYLSVGGGVVYDSTEEGEYQESLDKAASFTGGSRSLGRDI